MRILKLGELKNTDCIAAHYPTLEELEINVDDDDETDKKLVIDLPKKLQMNKQLRSLKVNDFDYDMEFYRVVSQFRRLKNLTTFGQFLDAPDLDVTIDFDTVESFETNLAVVDGLVSSKVAMNFHGLRELTIDTMNQNTIKFIENGYFPISKLNCMDGKSKLNNKLMETMPHLAKVLPSLEKLHFPDCIFTFHDITYILTVCDSLTSFSFKLASQFDIDDLLETLGNNWQASIDENWCATLLR